MGLFDKLKNVLFEDDEETEELPIIEKKEVNVKEENEVSEPRFKSSDLKNTTSRVNDTGVNTNTQSIGEYSEKPIFQTFDEEEFDRIAAINRNRLLERDRKAREKKEMERKLEEQQTKINNHDTEVVESRIVKKEIKSDTKVSYSKNTTISNRETTTHRFKPSPVISPVYGILDKNYRKEDILPRASSDGTLPKIMDVDNVRRKAFGILEEEIAKKDPLKNFQSENEEKSVSRELIEESVDEDILDNDKIDTIEKINNPIISFDNDIEDFTVEQPKNKSNVDEDTLESDLFNLIDSMYESREDK